MHRLRTVKDAEAFVRRVSKAIERKQPMTITYLKVNEDSPTGYEVTVRTIEPYEISVSKSGDPLLRALDRDTGSPRTWRMDRILFYSVHRSHRVLEHAY